MKLKWQFKQFLLKVLIAILALYIAVTSYKAYFAKPEPVKIIEHKQEISNSEYIITKEMIMSKLKAKSQIVSLEQDLNAKQTFVDDNWLGERHTELKLHGTYKLGLETKDIEVKHIDSQNGIVYIKLGKPILISLELPYDQIEFDKTKGWARLSMNETEEKNFYKAAKKTIEKELMSDKELMKQADLFNRDVVMDILKLIPEVKSVVFE